MEIILNSLGSMSLIFSDVWRATASVWFVVFPVAFYYIFKILWMDFVIGGFWGKNTWILLEITPPRDIEKSPYPMELIFSGLLGVMGGINTIEEYVDGKSAMYFSLELVSDEGNVHFYIRTTKGNQALVESHIYAQYPDAEVFEVPDYTENVPKIVPNKNWDLWGTDLILEKPDPYPIKTYKWFEESVTGKMIDPLAGLIESMGRIGKGQKIWIQWVITPKDFSEYDSGRLLADEIAGRKKPAPKGALVKAWEDMVEVFFSIFKGFFGPVEFSAGGDDGGGDDVPVEFALTPGEKEVLKAIESGIGKSTFQTKMRFVYIGTKENFNRVAIGSVMGSIKQFSDLNLNGFRPDNDSKTYALHLFAEPRLRYRQRKILNRYRFRSRDGKQFILNTEELATLFHFPDMQVTSPAVRRVETRTGSAPANLPVEIL